MLNQINFFQVYKRNPKTLLPISTGRKWKDSKSRVFEEKVKQIKQRAEFINKKLTA